MPRASQVSWTLCVTVRRQHVARSVLGSALRAGPAKVSPTCNKGGGNRTANLHAGCPYVINPALMAAGQCEVFAIDSQYECVFGDGAIEPVSHDEIDIVDVSVRIGTLGLCVDPGEAVHTPLAGNAGSEKIDGGCVPKRMRRDGVGQTVRTMCFLAGSFDASFVTSRSS